MSAKWRSKEIALYAALLRRIVRVLPPRSRERYGAELEAVYERLLAESVDESGKWGVRRRMPRLVCDATTAICLEFIDIWRGTWLSPARVAVAALVAAAGVWSLVALASLGKLYRAAAILDFSIPLTLILMLGLPVVSLVASRVGEGAASASEGHALLNTSIAVTAISWSLVMCHITA